MVIVIYTVLLLACSFTLCVFGFFVGRCARKLPILDDNLPWAVHRGQVRYLPENAVPDRGPTLSHPAVPRGTLRGPITMTSLLMNVVAPYWDRGLPHKSAIGTATRHGNAAADQQREAALNRPIDGKAVFAGGGWYLPNPRVLAFLSLIFHWD